MVRYKDKKNELWLKSFAHHCSWNHSFIIHTVISSKLYALHTVTTAYNIHLVFQECVTDVKHTTESKKSRRSSSQQRERTRSTCRSVTPEKRNEVSYVPEWATKWDWLSYTSLRQLQVLHSVDSHLHRKDGKDEFLNLFLVI